jgi:hypothetical protein
MRLLKSQKQKLLEWISEGLQSDEINLRAAVFDPPFEVSRQQVDGYRDRRAVELAAIRRAGEHDALTTGLALKSNRVMKLQQLAALMENDLFGGFLWTDQVKMIGSGPFAKEVDYEEFNTAEVQQYRATLDDIAKEVGHRRTGIDLATKELEEFLDRAKNNLPAEQYAALLTLAVAAGEG